MKPGRKNYLPSVIINGKFLVLSLLGVILVSGLLFFRYKIIFLFQYSRLQSIQCQQSQSNCLEKVWVHRVNSVERYNEVKKYFTGFETDIVYNDTTSLFYAYHPPLINGSVPITLDSFLTNVNDYSKRFWLDTRSVDHTNAANAIHALGLSKNSQWIKKSCIFELYDLDAAEAFHLSGYTVSYNVHPDSISLMLKDRRYYEIVKTRLKNIDYVSQESEFTDQLKSLFPGKKIITWHLSFYDYFGMRKISKLVNDQQVAILLVNIKTSGYR